MSSAPPAGIAPFLVHNYGEHFCTACLGKGGENFTTGEALQASAAELCGDGGAEPAAGCDGRGGAVSPARNPGEAVGHGGFEPLYNARALQLWLLRCCQVRGPSGRWALVWVASRALKEYPLDCSLLVCSVHQIVENVLWAEVLGMPFIAHPDVPLRTHDWRQLQIFLQTL